MRTGRKSLLTGELQAKLVGNLRAGLGVKASARATPLSIPTLFRWLARGRTEESGPYRDLFLAVQATQTTSQRVA
jgi:hypothetical protein